MRDRIAVSFDQFAYNLFAPKIEFYAEILLQRVVPIFDDVDGEQERAAQSVLAWSHWGPDDYDRAMDAAYDIAIDRALQFMQLRSVFLASGVSGLFHLFEKQLYKHLNRELRDWLASPIVEWRDASSLIDKLVNEGEDIAPGPTTLQARFKSVDLHELHLVANAIKHGDGRSYEKLRLAGAKVVDPNRLEGDWTVGPYSTLRVNVAILPEDVERYKNAVLEFWRLTGTFWAPRAAFP